ncbi:MAG: ABC transporter permease [Saprospiraceae bacterium]|nr:ABC transporter permease [Saprospiraceae bacterium]
MRLINIFYESFLQAYTELRSNILRTVLSLLGIIIGIFCIIAVQAAVDSFENNIRSSFEKLGNDVIYIDKRPWSDDDRDYWKYMRRPRPSFDDFKAIQARSKLSEISAYTCFIGLKTIKFQKNYVEGAFLMGVSEDYGDLFKIELEQGRFISFNDIVKGTPSIVLGNTVAKNIFGNADPIGRTVNISGNKLQVIGVIAKAGKSLINPLNFDEACIISYKTAGMFINLRGKNFGVSINAKALPGVNIEDLKDELTMIMRSERRLKPIEDDNFALNELSMLDKLFDNVFGILKLAGLIIGGFAILVGMFSVANIMFVSVRERYHIIGIKKALGAARSVILLEFLIESVVLCIIGGIGGLIMVFLVLKISSALTDFEMVLSVTNILRGMLLAVIVGILAGIIPALKASKLDPVEAIRLQ